ncbi:MAG: hypothetical protein ACRECF_00705 [Methyloceanibacter sp.]
MTLVRTWTIRRRSPFEATEVRGRLLAGNQFIFIYPTDDVAGPNAVPVLIISSADIIDARPNDPAG